MHVGMETSPPLYSPASPSPPGESEGTSPVEDSSRDCECAPNIRLAVYLSVGARRHTLLSRGKA